MLVVSYLKQFCDTYEIYAIPVRVVVYNGLTDLDYLVDSIYLVNMIFNILRRIAAYVYHIDLDLINSQFNIRQSSEKSKRKKNNLD